MKPPLVQALLDDNLDEFKQLYKDKAQAFSKDNNGYTAFELAVLLQKTNFLKMIEPLSLRTIEIVPKGQSKIAHLTISQFYTYFQVHYVPTLYFESYDFLQMTINNCPWLLQKSYLGRENRALGLRHREDLFSGDHAAIYIKWIDETLGFAVFAKQDIEAGSFIGEYAGKVRQLHRFRNDQNSYCLHYPTRFLSWNYLAIDALEFGNEMRFVNHSDTPNLKAYCLVDRGLLHMALFANQNISQGSELTFDYGKDFWRKRHKVIG